MHCCAGPGFPQGAQLRFYAAARRIGANSAAAGAFKLTQPRHAREASTSRTMQCVVPRGRGSPQNTLVILTRENGCFCDTS